MWVLHSTNNPTQMLVYHTYPCILDFNKRPRHIALEPVPVNDDTVVYLSLHAEDPRVFARPVTVIAAMRKTP